MSVTRPVPEDATGREAVVTQMCDAVDAGDAALFGSFFADGATYRFGSGPVVHGRDGLVDATRGAITSMPWTRHRVEQVAHVDDQLFCRFAISTADPTGVEVTMPCVTVIWLADGRIVDYRVHMDLSPLVT